MRAHTKVADERLDQAGLNTHVRSGCRLVREVARSSLAPQRKEALRPDGLARPVWARVPVPAGRQVRYEDQSPAGLLGVAGALREGGAKGAAFSAGVGDRDAYGTAVRCGMEAEVEVPAGDVSVLQYR